MDYKMMRPPLVTLRNYFSIHSPTPLSATEVWAHMPFTVKWGFRTVERSAMKLAEEETTKENYLKNRKQVHQPLLWGCCAKWMGKCF
jgi:hypothetical protein